MVQVLFDESEAARNKLLKQDEKAQKAKHQLTPRNMLVPRRKYAFGSAEEAGDAGGAAVRASVDCPREEDEDDDVSAS